MSGGAGAVAGKAVTIIVNGREREFDGKEITFREVVDLAFPDPWKDPNTIYTVNFTRGDEHNPQGSLADSESVKVKKGMIFNVTSTNRS